jgi:diacylglycerol kinase family enzyme
VSRRILIVANPVAGIRQRNGALEACVSRLEGLGQRVETVRTEGPGDAARLAREAAPSFELVAAMGGDGTVGQVADGLTGTETALGIIPTGSRNVLARELGLPRNPVAAAALLAELPVRRASLGWAAGRHFALCLSAGMDARVLQEAERLSPGRLTLRVFARAMLSTTLAPGPLARLRIRVEDAELEGSLAIVSNARTYAGYFRPAPEGGVDSPTLHLSVFHGRSRASVYRAAAAMTRGLHGRLQDVTTRSFDRLRLEPVDGPVPYERDGDLEGELPVEIRAAPGAVRLAAPPSSPTG